MANRSVLLALSAITGADLRYFGLVQCNVRDPSDNEELYLCTGKHNFYFLDRGMRGSPDGYEKQIPYQALKALRVDATDNELFELVFDNKSYPSCPPTVAVKSPARKEVLNNIEICYNTDFMFQHWKVGRLPIQRGPNVAVSFELRAEEKFDQDFTAPPTGKKKFRFGNYTFFCPDSFHAQMDKYTGHPSGVYAHSRRSVGSRPFFRVAVDAMVPMREGALPVQTLAKTLLNDVVSPLQDYKLVGVARRLHKKMNLTGDPAAWDGWIIHLRSLRKKEQSQAGADREFRDIAIISARRQYIPPVMDMQQDVSVVYYGSQKQFNPDPSAFLAAAEDVFDSFSPTTTTFETDTVVVQAKADALLLDEAAYSWYHTRLDIQPAVLDDARRCIKSTLNLLANAQLKFSADAHWPHLSVPLRQDDPFIFAAQMEKNAQGLPPSCPVPVRDAWRRRCWRYLAWAIDGGLLPGTLTIETLAYNIAALGSDPTSRNRVQHLLEALLHLRPTGVAFSWRPLAQLASDERVLRSFEFNPHVMETLLDTGYVRRALDETRDLTLYPRFLVRLLRRKLKPGFAARRLRYAVCKQLVSGSMSEGERHTRRTGDEVAMNTIVPALIDLLKSEDENIRVLVTVALVNYTQNNSPMKNVVMAGGAAGRVVRFLGSKHPDLVRHSCALLNNCTKSEQFRQTIASYGAVPSLLHLLERSAVPPAYPSAPVLVQVAAVLGNLAADSRLREKITSQAGTERIPDPRFAQYQQPVTLRLLVDLLTKEEIASEAGTQLSLLRAMAVFALKNLCVRHSGNKKHVGRMAVPTLVQLAQVPEQEPALLEVVLNCLYVLTFDDGNCHLMHEAGLEALLAANEGKPEVKSIVSQIRRRFKSTMERTDG